jgi:hypothetical protein
MKVIIAGSRDITTLDNETISHIVGTTPFKITELVNGGARGIDLSAYNWAKAKRLPIKTFIPEWDEHGRAAGPIRNRQMAEYADALIAIWDGKSRGTKNMIDTMKRLKKPVFIEPLVIKF